MESEYNTGGDHHELLGKYTNRDGVRAEEIKKSLAADVTEELMHAQPLAGRVKQLGGLVPGSASVTVGSQMQASPNTTDVVYAIQSVIAGDRSYCETRFCRATPSAPSTRFQ